MEQPGRSYTDPRGGDILHQPGRGKVLGNPGRG